MLTQKHYQNYITMLKLSCNCTKVRSNNYNYSKRLPINTNLLVYLIDTKGCIQKIDIISKQRNLHNTLLISEKDWFLKYLHFIFSFSKKYQQILGNQMHWISLGIIGIINSE